MRPDWPDSDRREFKRHEFRIACRIRATLEDGHPWVEDTWAVNISASGAYILSSIGSIPRGTIEVTLYAPAGLQHIFAFETVTTTARIVEAEVRPSTLKVVGLHVEFDEKILLTLM